ncbi:hypothetical protein DPMN_139876 [Dreissena polymorpha]|uniref:Uncharacterized protein n=1 Tax=Dreissena polymorpha TaxID=45954 RepID=A0A9D4G9T4_DREPO|nr:hypothetical protein DPMN_139876 [Dreissena polymorpha]
MLLCFAGCAVSPKGDKLYITTSWGWGKLLTLSRDGTVLAAFTDPELRAPSSVYVTPAGQKLVLGIEPNYLLQADSKGRWKLATLATYKDGIRCFSSTTSSIIVGN